MEPEEVTPEKPGFTLVFALSALTLVVLLVAVAFIFHFDARRMLPQGGANHLAL